MPVSAAASAREILARLHDVMAARRPAQAKLNQVVGSSARRWIARSARSTCCATGVLELFATRGLKQEAVHVTELALGEGLVGTIAEKVETLNLDEAASHPDFAYKPETGEELFHSFAGVPIVRRERAVGVLCVQHAEPRRYDEVEIEALQTVAMVLAELIANAGLVDERGGDGDRVRIDRAGPACRAEAGRWHGARACRVPPAAHHHRAYRRRGYRGRARSASIAAFAKMREQIDRMANQAEFGVDGEHQEVLETYKMFAYDEGWSRRINEAIDSGLTAEAAIERVQQRTRMRMRRDRRSAARRSDARSGGSGQPAAADRLGPARHRGAAWACGRTRS